MYDNGQGVTQDGAEAFRWFSKAAEQNFSRAQHSLGTMYENGRGVTADRVQALAWYRKAAANGDATSQTAAEALVTQATPEQGEAAVKTGL
jgi:TPR repeat protein